MQSALVLSLGLCIVIFNSLIIFVVTNRFNEVNYALQNNEKLYGNDEFNILFQNLKKKENRLKKLIEDETLIEINEVLKLSKDGIFSNTITSKSKTYIIENIKNNLNITLNEISAYLSKTEKMLDKFEYQKEKTKKDLNTGLSKLDLTVALLLDDTKSLYNELVNIKNNSENKSLNDSILNSIEKIKFIKNRSIEIQELSNMIINT